MTKKYDSTVARIAGNILSGYREGGIRVPGLLTHYDKEAVGWAVEMARAIVAEVERTEPAAPTSKETP